VSRADAAAQIVRAAIGLGASDGVGALSLQAIANAAGVSKALLLYHFTGKAALLVAVVDRLGDSTAAQLQRAAAAPDAMDAWRALARDRDGLGELALLAALTLEAEVATDALIVLRTRRAAREAAAATLATAILGEVRLTPRVPATFLGRLLLRQLDGLASARGGVPADVLEAELDTFALALLALGR